MNYPNATLYVDLLKRYISSYLKYISFSLYIIKTADVLDDHKFDENGNPQITVFHLKDIRRFLWYQTIYSSLYFKNDYFSICEIQTEILF